MIASSDDAAARPPGPGANSSKDEVVLGPITMGSRRDQIKSINLVDIKRHVLCVGGSGSGKTFAMKVIAEGLIARGVPVVAIDQMGDLTGLALPAGSEADYRTLRLTPPVVPIASWESASRIANLLRQRMYARVVTPCSAAGEQISIQPLTGRPRNYAMLAARDPQDLVLQADALAANILQRIGISVHRAPGKPPSLELGLATDLLMRCWEEDRDLTGPEGLQTFGREFLEVAKEALSDDALRRIDRGLTSLAHGAQALWFKGLSLDFDRLLRAPADKTPVLIVNVAHLAAGDRPWVIGQVVHAALNWASAFPSSPSKPRLALLLDELSGDAGANVILPPGNQRIHPSGEAIRRALRQGRHCGITVIAGAQSPGDIDYKSFSNFGTRIVGRLSTRYDVEKCTYGLDSGGGSVKKLEEYIVNARPGQLFVVPPAGDWDRVTMRMLGSVHATVQKADFERFYASGIWRRQDQNEGPDDMEIIGFHLEDLVTRYCDAMPAQAIELLERAAAIMRGKESVEA